MPEPMKHFLPDFLAECSFPNKFHEAAAAASHSTNYTLCASSTTTNDDDDDDDDDDECRNTSKLSQGAENSILK